MQATKEQMMFQAATVPVGGGRRVEVFGVQVDVGLTAADTGGVYSTYLVSGEPGVGSPPHVHADDDEAFLVLEGEWEIRRGSDVFRATPGTFVTLPRHIPHYFRNAGSGRGRMLGIVTPAGHEEFFADASRLSFPPDPDEAMAVCRKHGIELVP